MEIYRFSNLSFCYFKQFGHFANLEQFEIESHFSNFNQVEIDPSLLNWAGYGCFTTLGKILDCKKQSETSLFDNKLKNHSKNFHKLFSVIQSAG